MIKQRIGQRIKEIRTSELKITQAELAKKLGWDRTFLSRIESGKQNITIENLYSLCIAMNVSLKDFFSTFDNENSKNEISKNGGNINE